MTISNTEFDAWIWEIEFEGVDGTFSGKFLQSTNAPYSKAASPASQFPASGVGGSTRYGQYIDPAWAFADSSYTSSDRSPANIFAALIVEPAIKRIRAAHGDAPIRFQATRVFINTAAEYSTTDDS